MACTCGACLTVQLLLGGQEVDEQGQGDDVDHQHRHNVLRISHKLRIQAAPGDALALLRIGLLLVLDVTVPGRKQVLRRAHREFPKSTWTDALRVADFFFFKRW